MKIKLPKRHPSHKKVYKNMCYMHVTVRTPNGEYMDYNKRLDKWIPRDIFYIPNSFISYKKYIPFKTLYRKILKWGLPEGSTICINYNWEEQNSEFTKWKFCVKPILVRTGNK